MKDLAVIQTEACDSGLAKVDSPVALAQAKASLINTAVFTPPPPTLLDDLLGYWDGDTDNNSVAAGYDLTNLTGSAFDTFGGPNGGPACTMAAAILECADPFFATVPATPSTWNMWINQSEGTGVDIFGVFSGGSEFGYLPYITLDLHTLSVWAIDSTNVGVSSASFDIDVGIGIHMWYMLTLVVESGDITIYVNGSHVGTFSYDGYTSYSQPFRISGAAYNWNGQWANLGLWSRGLNAAEIATLYNSGLGLQYSELT